MPVITKISKQEFESFQQEARELTPLRKTVSLRSLEVVKENIVKLDGRHISMSVEAFKDLIKILGIPVSFEKEFKKNFGESALASLINRMRGAMSARGSSQVSILVSPISKKITGFLKNSGETLSNDAFLKVATQVIDKYDLDVNSLSVSANGSLVLNTSSSDNEYDIKGLSDEVFFGGVSFTNDYKEGFQVSPYVHRLVCSNGMMGKSFEENIKMKSLGSEDMTKFFMELNRLAANKFEPLGFSDRVKKAIATPASLAELDFSADLIRSVSGADLKEVQKWAPTMNTRAKYQDAGIETFLFTKDQLANAKSGVSVWDVVNGLTNFGSFDHGLNVQEEDKRKVQVQAGRLFTKKAYDIENLVNSPF